MPTDLVAVLTLVMVLMVSDARAGSVTGWSHIVAARAFGSFGPLAHLLFSSHRPYDFANG